MARKEAVFKMKLDSDDAVKNVKKLDKDFTSLRDTIEVDVSGSISAMEDRLYEMAAAGQTNTKEFKKLQKQTADYKKVVIETDRSIDALAEQGRGLSTALSLAEGTVAGFQAFTGISAVLGDENEELLETITKLQAAQGVLNSIQVIKQQLQEKSIALTNLQANANKALAVAVGTGSKAMRVFRAALVATGIGALIVGVGLLIANFDKLKKMVMGNTDAQDAYNDTIEDYKKGTETAIKQTNKVETAFNLARDGVISKEEALKTYNDTLGDSFGKAKNLNEAESLFVEKTDAYIEAAGLRAQADALFAKAAEESANAVTAGLEDQTGWWDESVASLKLITGGVDAAQKSISESQKAGVKEAQKNSQQRADIFSDLAGDMLAKARNIEKANEITSANSSITDENTEAQKRAEQAAKDRTSALESLKNKLASLREELERGANSEGQNDFSDALERRDEQLRIAREGYEKGIDDKRQYERNKFLIEQEFDNYRKQKEEEAAELEAEKKAKQKEKDAEEMAAINEGVDAHMDAELAKETRLVDEKNKIHSLGAEVRKAQESKLHAEIVNIEKNALSLISNLAELFAGKNEKRQKKAFEVAKKVNIASTIMSGIQGVVNALSATSVIPDPFGSILKAVNAASVAAATAVNVKKISATTFNGGGSSTPSTGSGIQGASAGSFNMSGANTDADITDLNPDGSQAGGDASPMDNKVYVVEQDITNTQNKAKATEAIATL